MENRQVNNEQREQEVTKMKEEEDSTIVLIHFYTHMLVSIRTQTGAHRK